MINFQIDQYQFEVFEYFEDVAQEWEVFNKNDGLSRSALQGVEQSDVKGIKPYYALVKHNGDLTGIMYFQMLNFRADFLNLSVFNKWYFNFIQFFINRLNTYLLINGNMFRTGLPAFYGLKVDEVARFTKVIAKEKMLGKLVCGIMVKDLPEYLSGSVVKQFAYKQMNQDVVMELKLRDYWETLEDYQKDLKRKYRKRFQKIIGTLDKVTIKKLTLQEIESRKEELEALYKNIVRQQVVRLGILNGSYFVQMKQKLQENFNIYELIENDTQKLIAFSSHIYYKDSMEIHYIGLDYEYNNEYQLYFNILYHGLEKAIEKKYKKLELGRTAKEAKASMGAEPLENINYYCVNNIFLAQITDKISKKFATKTGENWENRQPLK